MNSGAKRVLVTGGRGFVGRPCIDRLIADGWRIDAVTSRSMPPIERQPAVRWHFCDLLDPVASRALIEVAQPTHLLHLAWHMGADVYGSPENHRWVAASLELLRAFSDAGGQRAVFAGSCAEYDWSDGGVCSEASTPLRPASTYGQCKHALADLFEDFVGRDDTPSGAWARLFFLFGPHEQPKRLIASVIRSLLRGETARCSHGQQRRDYLFTLDAADALVTLLASDVSGAINIGSGQPTRLEDLIRGVARQLDRDDLIELGAIAVPEDEPPLILADVRRLQEELGWQNKWQLDAALEHTIEWWRTRVGAS